MEQSINVKPSTPGLPGLMLKSKIEKGNIMENKNIVNGFDFSALPIKIDYVGKVEDKEWPHFLWNVTITMMDRKGYWTVPYKTGVGLVVKPKVKTYGPQAERPKNPTNADIIYSLLLDAESADESFSAWCDNFGYNDDSIKALNIYKTCCEEAEHLRKTFTPDQIEAMQKALEYY